MKASLADIGGAVIWSASAVAVAGYTFTAYKETYSTFPGLGSGDNSTLAKAQDAAASSGADKTLNKIGIGPSNPFFKAVRRISGILGIGGSVTQQSGAAVSSKWQNQFRTAVRAGNKTAAMDLYKQLRNSLDHTLKPANSGYLGAYSEIYSMQLWPQFEKLTGVKPPGQ